MMKVNTKAIACLCIAALLLACGLSSAAQAEHFKVFLLGGQSNMDGRAATSGLPTKPINLQQPQTDVLFYEGGSLRDLQPGSGMDFGPEITFGRTIADAKPDERFVLIKYAVGGTNLHTDWDPADGGKYASFKSAVEDGLKAAIGPDDTYEIVGMLWTQGEADAASRSTAEYELDLNEFIAAIRGEYGRELPFFVSRLSDTQTAIDAARLANIRAAQENVASNDQFAYLVDTDGMSMKGDNLHFDADGQIALGEAFAASYLASTPEPSSLGLMGIGALLLLQRR